MSKAELYATALEDRNIVKMPFKWADVAQELRRLEAEVDALTRQLSARTKEMEFYQAHASKCNDASAELLEALEALEQLASKYAGEYPTQVGTIASEAIAKHGGGA